MNPDIIAYIGSFILIITYIPQAFKVYKTHRTEDLSFWFLLLASIGTGCWFIYAFWIMNWPLIFVECGMLPQQIFILVWKVWNIIRYRESL